MRLLIHSREGSLWFLLTTLTAMGMYLPVSGIHLPCLFWQGYRKDQTLKQRDSTKLASCIASPVTIGYMIGFSSLYHKIFLCGHTFHCFYYFDGLCVHRGEWCGCSYSIQFPNEDSLQIKWVWNIPPTTTRDKLDRKTTYMEKATHSFKTYIASCPKSNHKIEKSEGRWTKPDEKPLEPE